PANSADSDGFDQELRENVVALGADGFADADFAGALGDRDQHDVHHSNAAHDQADRSYREHQDENHAADFVPQIEEIVGGKNREIVRFVVAETPLAPQQFTGLVDGFGDALGAGGFHKEHVVLLIRIELAQRGHGHDSNVVFGIGAAGDALLALFHRADHGEELAVQSDFFSDRVGGRTRKKRAGCVVAEHDDRRTMLGVIFVERAAVLDFHIEDAIDRGRIALQDDVFGAKSATANVGGAGAELRHEDAHGGRSGGDMRQ